MTTGAKSFPDSNFSVAPLKRGAVAGLPSQEVVAPTAPPFHTRKPLSKRDKSVLVLIHMFCRLEGRNPSLSEIANISGLPSKTAASRSVQRLVRRNCIVRVAQYATYLPRHSTPPASA